METLQDNPALFWGIVTFVALMVGSFLNVVIHRLPIMMERAWLEGIKEFEAGLAEQNNASTAAKTGLSTESDAAAKPEIHDSDLPFNLAVPRSRCPSCGLEIKAWQNVPVFSYLALGGKCSGCKTRISIRYPLVEIFTMLLSLIVAWQLGPTPQALLGIVVTWFFIAMSMIDIDHQLLPDSMTLPLMWIGLLLAAVSPVFTDLHSAVLGAAAGYMILWTVYQLFRIITGKEGMGFGDFKLLAAIGALLGWQALPMVILLSSLVGAVVGIGLIAITGRDKNIPIPFGPYLAAAGWIAMLWGDSLSNWYHGLLL